MFLLKLLVGVSAIAVAVKIGKDRACKDKRVYLFFNALALMCDKILTDLSYKKSDVNSLLKGDFNSIELNKTLKTYIKSNKLILPSFLNGDETFLVSELFNSLGKLDTASQIRHIEVYKAEVNKIAKEKYENYKKYSTLFVKLGFVGGLLIFVLVI